MKKQLQTICRRIKLKENSLPKVKAWANELANRKEEALETLRGEGVYIESVFLEKTNDGNYLIAFMKLNSLEEAAQAVKKSKHPIDTYHQRFKKECWESNEDLELLLDLDRYSEMFNE